MSLRSLALTCKPSDIREENDPSTTAINDMHNDVVTTGITSIPEMHEKTPGHGDVRLCKCWNPCATGGCDLTWASTFVPPGSNTWPISVEFVPPEPVNDSVRCSPVESFTLEDRELNMLLTNLPNSRFYLISEQPGGVPFFPARVVGSGRFHHYFIDSGSDSPDERRTDGGELYY